MKKEPMQKLNLGEWYNQADQITRQRFIAAQGISRRLKDVIPQNQLSDMTRKIIKNQGRSDGTFYGFDSVQNPGNYLNIPKL